MIVKKDEKINEKVKTFCCFICEQIMTVDPYNRDYPFGGSVLNNTWASRYDQMRENLYICDRCIDIAVEKYGEVK